MSGVSKLVEMMDELKRMLPLGGSSLVWPLGSTPTTPRPSHCVRTASSRETRPPSVFSILRLTYELVARMHNNSK